MKDWGRWLKRSMPTNNSRPGLAAVARAAGWLVEGFRLAPVFGHEPQSYGATFT